MKRFLSLLFLGVLCTSLSAEVLFLRNGEIVIGAFVSADSGTMTLKSMGTERTISSTDVLRTEKELKDISEMTLQVVLKGGRSAATTSFSFHDGYWPQLPPATTDMISFMYIEPCLYYVRGALA